MYRLVIYHYNSKKMSVPIVPSRKRTNWKDDHIVRLMKHINAGRCIYPNNPKDHKRLPKDHESAQNYRILSLEMRVIYLFIMYIVQDQTQVSNCRLIPNLNPMYTIRLKTRVRATPTW